MMATVALSEAQTRILRLLSHGHRLVLRRFIGYSTRSIEDASGARLCWVHRRSAERLWRAGLITCRPNPYPHVRDTVYRITVQGRRLVRRLDAD